MAERSGAADGLERLQRGTTLPLSKSWLTRRSAKMKRSPQAPSGTIIIIFAQGPLVCPVRTQSFRMAPKLEAGANEHRCEGCDDANAGRSCTKPYHRGLGDSLLHPADEPSGVEQKFGGSDAAAWGLMMRGTLCLPELGQC